MLCLVGGSVAGGSGGAGTGAASPPMTVGSSVGVLVFAEVELVDVERGQGVELRGPVAGCELFERGGTSDVLRGALRGVALVFHVDGGGAADSDDRGRAVPTLQDKLGVLGLRLAVKVDDVAGT